MPSFDLFSDIFDFLTVTIRSIIAMFVLTLVEADEDSNLFTSVEPLESNFCISTGSEIQFLCETNATDEVTWTIPDLLHCFVKVPTGPDLTIYNLAPVHSGEYTCSATLENITDTRTFHLQVTGNALDCDFKKNDLCQWEHDLTNAGTWRTNTGTTPTDETGPDHGHGETEDYVYHESSEGSFGDKVELISRVLLPSSDENCFTFWYYMFGKATGSLIVILETFEKLPTSKCNISTTELFRIDGQQGTQWLQANLTIPPTPVPYRILIQSIKGDGTKGDTAVDEIRYLTGSCNASAPVIAGLGEETILKHKNDTLNLTCDSEVDGSYEYRWTVPERCSSCPIYAPELVIPSVKLSDAGLYVCTLSNHAGTASKIFHVSVDVEVLETCTLEDSSFCGLWMQDSSDKYDWTFNHGPTITEDTGPMNGHGTGENMYVYLEASSPAVQGDTAGLISDDLPANQDYCLSFFYNMHGEGMGGLNVTVQDLCTGEQTTMFSIDGDQGQEWHEQMISIVAPLIKNSYRVKFVGIVGSSYLGDVALDDIRIEPGICGINCNFKNDSCRWTQSQSDDFDWSFNVGNTSSPFTGPEGDHTQPDGLGQYMYIEDSGRDEDATADLVSVPLPAGYPFCFTLFTHLYGRTMNPLDVMLKGTSDIEATIIAIFNKTVYPDWIQQDINIPAQSEEFQIIIRGTSSYSFEGDAAIDDLSIRSGLC